MGLFDLFKKQDDNSPAKEELTKAKEHFNKGEFQECLRTLAWGFKKDVNYKPLYKLAADSLGKLNAPDEQKLFEEINRSISNSNGFNSLGNFYFGVGHYELAQVFYEKTIQLNPNNEEAPHDLAISYARRFQVGKAVEVLTQAKSNDFWNIYFLNKCKILDKKIDGVQETIDNLQIFLNEQANQNDVAIPKMKVDELQETLYRYNSVENVQTHIRDWQFIQYGGVVLDYFEDEGEDDEYVAGGRYVASWGSNESIKSIGVKLKQFTDRLSISINSVVALSDRDSEITGRVLAKEFKASFSFYEPTNSNENCLIVSSDSSHFQEYEELNTIHKGQIVFSLNHSWLDSSTISPDIIGFMTQTYSFPWSGDGMRIVDIESKNIEKIPEDNRTTEEIATDIFSLNQNAEVISNHLTFYEEHKDFLKGIGKKTNNNRYNFMIESPVPGSYFG